MAFPPGTSCLSLLVWLWSPGGSFLMTLFFMDLLLIIPWCLARFRSLKRMARLQALLDPTAWAMDEYAAIFILWLRLRISSMDDELGAFFLILKSVRMNLRANLILWELVFRVTPFGVMVGASRRSRRPKLKEKRERKDMCWLWWPWKWDPNPSTTNSDNSYLLGWKRERKTWALKIGSWDFLLTQIGSSCCYPACKLRGQKDIKTQVWHKNQQGPNT